MKGTATMPMPGLSAGTRQCACGGWTRFIVCQYCGTTDPAFAEAGMVSTTPLVVPERDSDPQAIPPAPPVQATSGDYAGLEAAVTRRIETSVTPSAFTMPAQQPTEEETAPAYETPEPLVPPLAATVSTAPEVETDNSYARAPEPVFAPSWPPSASIDDHAVMSEAEIENHPEISSEDAAEKVAPNRRRRLIIAAVLVLAALIGGYFGLSRGSDSDSSSAPVTKAKSPAVSALLSGTVPTGATAAGTVLSRPVSTVTPLELTGRTADGITARSRYVIRVNGLTLGGSALTFGAADAATAFAAGPAIAGSNWTVSQPAAGLNLWAQAGTEARAIIVAKDKNAFVLSGTGDASIDPLKAWATKILS